MNKIALSLTVVGVAAPFFYAAPAHAQATRTWVSGVGDDVNPCSRTAPCKTFAGAISKTALNGEINCLDPGGFGTLTITKSITVDCSETAGSILNASVNAINIPFDNFVTAGEVRKTVRLRHLRMNGANTGTNGVRITGGAASAGSEVFVEYVLIDGNFAGTGRGITDERTGGGKLFVSNTRITNMSGIGIAVSPPSGSVKVDVSLDNVRVHNTLIGVLAGNGTRMMLSNSVVSGNTTVGVEADPGSEINVQNTVITANATGVAQAGGAVLRLSNSDLAFNTSNVSGTPSSFGNNRLTGGGALTLIGAQSHDSGQQ